MLSERSMTCQSSLLSWIWREVRIFTIESVANCSNQPVVHFDRGAHYRWPGWLSRISDSKLTHSISRKGCSPDNAACEGFFGRQKTQLFYPRDWKATTIEQIIQVFDS